MVAEKLGSLDEMERLLRQIIQIKPDYHHAYNALGYSLADRNIRLPEARELIRKALEFAPADPFIKDSLGWVEFRMGNTPRRCRFSRPPTKPSPTPKLPRISAKCSGAWASASAPWPSGKKAAHQCRQRNPA